MRQEPQRADLPEAERSPDDVCNCGDARRSHDKGTGRCGLGSLCTPVQCLRFRLFHTAAEAEVNEADLLRRHRESVARRDAGAGA